MTINYKKESFLSANGHSQIAMGIYEPKGQPIGVLQIVHGMAEHMSRYDAFARFMAEAGLVVCLHDHTGHGQSLGAGPAGYFAPRGGHHVLIADTLACGRHIKKAYEGLPFILMGHSMGSFVVRCLAARHPDQADALILMGTGALTPAPVGGYALAQLCCLIGLGSQPNRLLDWALNRANLAGITAPATQSDWLSYNRDNVTAYRADPLCGFAFTSAGFRDLLRLIIEANLPRTAQRTRPTLPILLISGADDPVGGFGKGVRKVQEAYVRAGCRATTLMLIPRMRHEILNETDRQPVFDALRDWARQTVLS